MMASGPGFWVESRRRRRRSSRRQRRRKTLDRKSWPLMGNDGASARASHTRRSRRAPPTYISLSSVSVSVPVCSMCLLPRCTRPSMKSTPPGTQRFQPRGCTLGSSVHTAHTRNARVHAQRTYACNATGSQFKLYVMGTLARAHARARTNPKRVQKAEAMLRCARTRASVLVYSIVYVFREGGAPSVHRGFVPGRRLDTNTPALIPCSRERAREKERQRERQRYSHKLTIWDSAVYVPTAGRCCGKTRVNMLV